LDNKPTERGAVFMTKYSRAKKIAAKEVVKGGESIPDVPNRYRMSEE